MSTLGERIKQVRKELAMTQEQLAGTDFTKGFISQVELNRINPSLKSLQLLAARLDRPVNFFLDDRDSRRLKEIDLLNSTGETHLYRGDLSRALVCFQAAREQGTELDNPGRRATALLNLSRVRLKAGETIEGLNGLKEALAAFTRLKDTEQRGRILDFLGQAYARKGSWEQAVENFRQGLAVMSEGGPGGLWLRSRILAHLGQAYQGAGRYPEAVAAYEEALSLMGGAGDVFAVAEIFFHLSEAHRERGDLDQALSYSHKALKILEIREQINLIGGIHRGLGVINTELGEWGEALACYRRSLELSRYTGDIEAQVQTLDQMTAYHCRNGEMDTALELCEEALGLLENIPGGSLAGRVYRTAGSVMRTGRRWAEAAAYLEKSEGILVETGSQTELADTYTELGMLAADQDLQEKAGEYFQKAISIFKGLEVLRAPA